MNAPPIAPRANAPIREPSIDRLANHGERFVGMLIDSILDFGSLCVGVPIAAMDPNFGKPEASPGPLVFVGGFVSLIAVFTVTGLQWYWIATLGQSAGKRLMKTQIRRLDGSKVDFVSGVILRSWIVNFAFGALHIATCGFLGWVVHLVDALMILGADQRCLHDRIADTKVIKLGD
ncbi:MAG: RDD family protein [Pirellula sp.]